MDDAIVPMYKTAQYGFLLVVSASVIGLAILESFQQGNEITAHPVVAVVFLLIFAGCALTWGLITLVHNRDYAAEFKFHFDRTGMEKPLRWLLRLIGIVVTDELPLCTAALFSSLAIVIAIGMTGAWTVRLCFLELFVP
jgi:hypothetical protein